MTAILILAASIVVVGLLLFIHHRITTPAAPRTDREDGVDTAFPAAGGDAAGDSSSDDGECCGMHITCEKDSLLAAVSETIEYFDDEELDRFAGRAASDYSTAEADEFRDVMLTMSPDEIAPWARSLQLRGIELPAPVRDELLLIVAEARKPHKQ